MKPSLAHFLIAGAIALGALPASAPARAAEPFTFTSSSFTDDQMLDRKYSNNTPGNSNCVGQNVSPAFAWANPPEGTKSYVLLMLDPEGRGGLGVSHWVAYGIPVSVTSFAEGEVSKPSEKYVGGKSLMGVGNYSGPCTLPGPPHHYLFTLIATDFDPKALPPGLTRDEVLAQLPGHTKGSAGIVARFQHP